MAAVLTLGRGVAASALFSVGFGSLGFVAPAAPATAVDDASDGRPEEPEVPEVEVVAIETDAKEARVGLTRRVGFGGVDGEEIDAVSTSMPAEDGAEADG